MPRLVSLGSDVQFRVGDSECATSHTFSYHTLCPLLIDPAQSCVVQERHIRHELSLLKQCAGHPNVVQLQGYLWTTERWENNDK